jgi:hypothetical protein
MTLTSSASSAVQCSEVKCRGRYKSKIEGRSVIRFAQFGAEGRSAAKDNTHVMMTSTSSTQAVLVPQGHRPCHHRHCFLLCSS